MRNVVVDFESYYSKADKVSVVDQGLHNYRATAEAYVVGIADGDQAVCGTLEELLPTLDKLARDPHVQIWAAHSNFDFGWCEKYRVKSANPWKCILDLGVFHQMPRNLADLAETVLGEKVDKGVRDEMDGVDYWTLDAAKQERVQRYCLNDVLIEKRILDKLPPMSPVEDRIAEHTRLVNWRGVRVDTDLVEQHKEQLYKARFASFRLIPWHNDENAKPLSTPALHRWCHSKGIPAPASTAKTDEECEDLMSEHPALNEVLTTMRRFRKSNTMLRKIETLRMRMTPEGYLPLDLIYCGAPHTRRWSSKGFNVQNLDKKPIEFDGGVSIFPRNWLIPRPGKTFLILDLAQIEPRCLNWLAGNTELLEAIRSGYSYYEAYARMAKGWKGAPGTLKKEFGNERYTKLKNEALGCGYGMGARKYTTYADVPFAEAEEIVKEFRRTNPQVVALWKRLDNLIVSAARGADKVLEMRMPTGDALRHFNIRAKAGGGYQSYTVKGSSSLTDLQPQFWGGVLTENITQRMSRDKFAEGVLDLEDAGFLVAFHSHDETILEVDIGSDKSLADAKREAERILSTPPEWAPDLPLGCEGEFAPRYTKI